MTKARKMHEGPPPRRLNRCSTMWSGFQRLKYHRLLRALDANVTSAVRLPNFTGFVCHSPDFVVNTVAKICISGGRPTTLFENRPNC